MMQHSLSPAQRRVLDVALQRQKELGGAVTLAEISSVTKSAVSTLHVHVRNLVEQGVAKKSDRGPGFIFRRPKAEISVRLFLACERLGLSKEQTVEIVKAGEGW